MIALQHPVTEDVSWLSGIQEAPAESTLSEQRAVHTHIHDAHTLTGTVFLARSLSLFFSLSASLASNSYTHKHTHRPKILAHHSVENKERISAQSGIVIIRVIIQMNVESEKGEVKKKVIGGGFGSEIETREQRAEGREIFTSPSCTSHKYDPRLTGGETHGLGHSFSLRPPPAQYISDAPQELKIPPPFSCSLSFFYPSSFHSIPFPFTPG